MKISEILKKETLSLSFEVFPPKTDSSFESVKDAVHKIAELRPSFMSVTYGAGGGTSKYTLDIAEDIKQKHGVPTLAHLTCVSSTKDTVKEMIENIRNAGISNVMALRGDIPESMINDDRSKWEYLHAVDLVRELKESGADFCIGGVNMRYIYDISVLLTLVSAAVLLNLTEKSEGYSKPLTGIATAALSLMSIWTNMGVVDTIRIVLGA